MNEWKPYSPGMFRWREVVRQLGYKPTVYVMRKREGGRWIYRGPTPQELGDVETNFISSALDN